MEGDGWVAVRPAAPASWEEIEDLDHLLTDVEWLFSAIERECVAECCGLAAFDFSLHSIQYACGDAVDPPADTRGAYKAPVGDRGAAADVLRAAADHLRPLSSTGYKSTVLNEFLTAGSWAALFDDLATKLLTGAAPTP